MTQGYDTPDVRNVTCNLSSPGAEGQKSRDLVNDAEHLGSEQRESSTGHYASLRALRASSR